MGVIRHPEQRVAVIIDTQNLYHSAKNLYKSKVNFANVVAAAVQDRKLVRAMSYVVNTEGGEETAFFEAMEKVGKEGVITVEEAKSMDSTMEVVEGMQFDRGYLSPYFVTDPERMEAVIEDAYVLVNQGKISAIADVLPVLDLGVQKAVQLLYRLRALPTPERVARIGACWAPHRTVASWYLWRRVDDPPQ